MSKKQTKKTAPAKPVATKKTAKPKGQGQAETKAIQIIKKVVEDKAIISQDVGKIMTRPQIELIKRTIAKGASDDELSLFINVCRGSQLNPFLRQVHLVKRWDSKDGKEVATIQVGIDGFRAIAESSGAYAGNDDAVFEEDSKTGMPVKATVTVYKIVSNNRYAFTATARWAEYYPGEKQGFMWRAKPHVMLGKCAEAQALRKAFPKLLSGMYAPEEMDQAGGETKDQKAQQNAFEVLKKNLDRMGEKQLNELKAKMEKSDKYTKEQKTLFFAMVGKRIEEIQKIKQKENAGEKIATINV